MLKVSHIVKEFNSGGGRVKAVNDMSFQVAQGQFASIIGRSGSGKSTLLSLLGVLDSPTSGSIEIDEKDIAKLHDHALIEYRRRKIGFVFQNYNLVPNLTAIENVMLPMEYDGGLSKQDRRNRAIELLEKVGIIAEKQQRKPGRMSGGEQQRVAIARALANRPSLVLADEPTGNLDSENGAMIFELLHDLAKKQRTTIIVVTHDLDIAGKTDITFRLQDGTLKKGK